MILVSPWKFALYNAHPHVGVGKTCLLMQYASKNFIKTFITTIGIDFKIKTVNVCGKTVKLQVSRADSLSCTRFGIPLVRSASVPSPLPTSEVRRVFCLYMMLLTVTLSRAFLPGWSRFLRWFFFPWLMCSTLTPA